jgi:RNA polymerase sigma-70 factor (ECF subfamily)
MERSRDELRAFAYWMSGSLRFAEDLADRTIFTAGRLPDLPVEPAPRRAWLLGCAARECSEALADLSPRSLPALLHPPADPALPPSPPAEPSSWLEPFPDEFYPERPEPGEGAALRYGSRESVSFAFLAALQPVPVQARAALVLHDLLGEGISELSGVLNLSGSNVEDLLDYARDAVDDSYDRGAGRREPPPEERATDLFMRYLFPWETGDLEGLTARLADDVVLQLPPSPSWYRGREAVRSYLSTGPFAGEARGRWRLLPRRANGQLAFGLYRRDEEHRMFKAHALQVIFFEGEAVSEIVSFADPWLFPSFELLPEVYVQG